MYCLVALYHSSIQGKWKIANPEGSSFRMRSKLSESKRTVFVAGKIVGVSPADNEPTAEDCNSRDFSGSLTHHVFSLPQGAKRFVPPSGLFATDRQFMK